MSLPQPALASPIQEQAYAGCSFLYCHDCQLIIDLPLTKPHLLRHHSAIFSLNHRKQLIDYFATRFSQQVFVLPPLPPDGSTPISFLHTHDGFACGHSRACCFLSRNYKAMRAHLNAAHAIYRKDCAAYIRPVALQTWYSDAQVRYWIVTQQQQQQQSPITAAEEKTKKRGRKETIQEKQRQAQLDAFEALQAIEAARSQQAESEHAIVEAQRQQVDSGTTPWLQHTQWPAQFADRPLDVIATTALKPAHAHVVDFALGSWQRHQLISSREDELKLSCLVQALDPMFQRCLDTLDVLPGLQREQSTGTCPPSRKNRTREAVR